MELVTVKQKDYRLARAWYILFPLDAYAVGPLRFQDPVDASQAVEHAESQFGEKPKEVWPEGEVIEVDDYEYEVSVPEEDRDMYDQ